MTAAPFALAVLVVDGLPSIVELGTPVGRIFGHLAFEIIIV